VAEPQHQQPRAEGAQDPVHALAEGVRGEEERGGEEGGVRGEEERGGEEGG